jgi:hypothetical protein
MHTEGKWDEDYWKLLQNPKDQVKGVHNNWQNYWAIKKFAGKLKQIASIMTGISVDDMESQELKGKELGEEWWFYEVGVNQYWSPDDYLKQATQPGFDWLKKAPLIKPTLRWFLQNLGTDAIRNNIHPNAWVNALFVDYKPIKKKVQVDDVDERIEQFPNWIITDLRFPNEFDAVKKRGGVCIRVERNFEDFQVGDAQVRKDVNPIDLHPSETALDNYEFDLVLNNSSDLEALKAQVVLLYSWLKEKQIWK